MQENCLPTPQTVKTMHSWECWKAAAAPRQSILHLGFQQLGGRQGTRAPLWPVLWSGARFWLDSQKWQVEEKKVNPFTCIPCLLAAIQYFMSGVLYAGGYKENCFVFSLCLKKILFEHLLLSPSIQNTHFLCWKGTSCHWYKKKIYSSHHYFINSVCNSQ